MKILLMVLLSFGGYLAAYLTYGRLLSNKIFRLSADRITPAHRLEDGKDFIPTRKGVVFGHHFTSIAGTGPIVGPAIGIIWGWLPALVWVLVGSIFMGAVHDFGALVISLRNEGRSISDITASTVNKRTRIIFFIVVMLELWIVIAVFGLVIAAVFKIFPESVLPVWLQIPVAVALGFGMRATGGKGHLAMVAVAMAVMIGTLFLGQAFPVVIPATSLLKSSATWSLLLFLYAFIAAILPVNLLLQPRDYINAWQLIAVMALMVFGLFAAAFRSAVDPAISLELAAPAVNPDPAGAPPLWPFLFTTIACGAISGFHALVSSGTSAKQLRSEKDALFVGYGSMLLEGALAVMVIAAVAGGIGMSYESASGEILTGSAAWMEHYSSWQAGSGLGAKLDAFVTGTANMIAASGFPRSIAVVIMGLFIASFAGTTLDTAARLQRYVVQELSSSLNLRIGGVAATALAVLTAAVLAFSSDLTLSKLTAEGTRSITEGFASLQFTGSGAMKLWPMFGAVNQALAALSLMVLTMYLKGKGGLKFLITLGPALFMVIMTFWALIHNEVSFIREGNVLLSIVNGIVISVTLWMTVETGIRFGNSFRGQSTGR